MEIYLVSLYVWPLTFQIQDPHPCVSASPHLARCSSPAGTAGERFPDMTCTRPTWAERWRRGWPAPAAGARPAGRRTSDADLADAQAQQQAASRASAEPAWLVLLCRAKRGKHGGHICRVSNSNQSNIYKTTDHVESVTDLQGGKILWHGNQQIQQQLLQFQIVVVVAEVEVANQRIGSFHYNVNGEKLSGKLPLSYIYEKTGWKINICRKRVASHSGNVAKTKSCLANKLSWKIRNITSDCRSTLDTNWPLCLCFMHFKNDLTLPTYPTTRPVLTISWQLGFSAMRVVITSRSFLSWKSAWLQPFISWWRNASFRDLRNEW